MQTVSIFISRWFHRRVQISLVNDSEKTVDPINPVSGKEYSEDWEVTDKANILLLNKHSRTGEDDKWRDCVSLKTDWTNGMLDFALREIDTPSAQRAAAPVRGRARQGDVLRAAGNPAWACKGTPAHWHCHFSPFRHCWKWPWGRVWVFVEFGHCQTLSSPCYSPPNLLFSFSFTDFFSPHHPFFFFFSLSSPFLPLPPALFSLFSLIFYPVLRKLINDSLRSSLGELRSYGDRKKRFISRALREAVHIKNNAFCPVFAHSCSPNFQLVSAGLSLCELPLCGARNIWWEGSFLCHLAAGEETSSAEIVFSCT